MLSLITGAAKLAKDALGPRGIIGGTLGGGSSEPSPTVAYPLANPLGITGGAGGEEPAGCVTIAGVQTCFGDPGARGVGFSTEQFLMIGAAGVLGSVLLLKLV